MSIIAFFQLEHKRNVDFSGGKLTFSNIYFDYYLIISYNMAMNVSRTDTIRGLWDELNQVLFTWIDDNIGKRDATHRLFMTGCEAVVKPHESTFGRAARGSRGRPRRNR